MKRTAFRLTVLMSTLLGPSPSAFSADAPDPKPLFTKHCVSCHGPDGKARTPVGRQLGVKDLTVSKTTDAEMEKQILEGKKDEKGIQKMPPFKDKLKPEELKALLEFAKGLRK